MSAGRLPVAAHGVAIGPQEDRPGLSLGSRHRRTGKVYPLPEGSQCLTCRVTLVCKNYLDV